MNKLKKFFEKLFGGLNMSWPTVILYAVVTGVYTGLIMVPDFLKETSFQDIGISYEWWVIFAVILVVNCKKNWEAMAKCFVFFLVSQPLVYLTEVFCGSLALEMGIYYYRTIWFKMTLLTIPGGLIAWYCKKQNVLGAVVLGLGNAIQMLLGIFYFAKAVMDFPHHLLSALTSFVSIVIMTFFIQKEKKQRIIAFVTPVAVSLAAVLFVKLSGLSFGL